MFLGGGVWVISKKKFLYSKNCEKKKKKNRTRGAMGKKIEQVLLLSLF